MRSRINEKPARKLTIISNRDKADSEVVEEVSQNNQSFGGGGASPSQQNTQSAFYERPRSMIESLIKF